MKYNLLQKDKKETDLEQAKILSINLLKGRITISMRNGLITTASYLHDITDLRAGMSVLVGKVDDSYVILNKVENIPRTETSYSLNQSYPSDYILFLKFEGEEGVETWVDEINGSAPSSNYGNFITTSQRRFGRSCLQMGNQYGCSFAAHQFNYLNNDFSAECYFRNSGIDTSCFFYYKDILSLTAGGMSNAHIDIHLLYYDIEGYCLAILASDTDDNVVVDILIPNPFPDNTWHKYKIETVGRNLSLYLDDVLYDTWTAIIDNPFDTMYDLAFSNMDPYPAWIDNVLLRGSYQVPL
jgi:hypothetical protein